MMRGHHEAHVARRQQGRESERRLERRGVHRAAVRKKLMFGPGPEHDGFGAPPPPPVRASKGPGIRHAASRKLVRIGKTRPGGRFWPSTGRTFPATTESEMLLDGALGRRTGL